MNFTEFCDSLVDPLYEAKGEKVCPPGYRYDKKQMMCVPKTQKDRIDGDANPGDKDGPPGNAAYNVWGSSGYDGGYALELENEAN